MTSIGRNVPNKNYERTLSGDNLYHKKKIKDTNDNNNINSDISTGPKLKSSNTNTTNKKSENENIPSPNKREKLIRISELKVEQAVDNNKNEKKSSLNNKELIDRLKNQSCSLKSSIINKYQNNILNNKAINHIFASKEIFCLNKHLTKEQLLKGMNILSKHDTYELGPKKYINADKNKFNKNAYLFKEKHNNSNNLSKNKNKKQNDILFKIKNLKTLHPNKYNSNNKAINEKKDNIENINQNNKEKENKKNIINENKTNADKNEDIIVKEGGNSNKENKDVNENKDIQNNENIEPKNKERNEKEKPEITVVNENKKSKEIMSDKNINVENYIQLRLENKHSDIITTKNDTNEFNISQEKIIYFDTTHITNVQIPKDYINVIYYNLLIEENNDLISKPVHTYMKKQSEINVHMRSILVDWIIDVHHKFGFTDETLFMTILIIDRYCTSEQISRMKYQCLGITALMIACKHEEINLPKVDDFIYITDNAYTKEEVFKMENDVLSKLNFELLYPSPIKFFEYLSIHFNFCKKYHLLGKYLMETFLLDLKYIKYKPSIISCACAYIVMKFFKMDNYRQSYEKKFYLLDENVNIIPTGFGVKDCAQDICIYVDNINSTNLFSCQKKYSKPEFERVATLISNNKT